MSIQDAVYTVNEISELIQEVFNKSLQIVVPDDSNIIRTFVDSANYVSSQTAPGALLASFTAAITGTVRMQITWKSESATTSGTTMTLDLRTSDDGFASAVTIASTRSKTAYETAVIDIGITAGTSYKLYFVHPGTYSGICTGLVMKGIVTQRDPQSVVID